ncbi:MAG: sce7725 family protein [Lachnospiraceae bacterium]|nr:sce7725 family protein [Lachnospiraceae bacterium]
MYFPYLRGRQNEMLCLRELLDAGKLGEKVTPIIEPVRFNSTFFSTLTKFIENDRKIILIVNAKVGSFNQEYAEMKQKIETETDESKKDKIKSLLDTYVELLKDPHVQRAYIVDRRIVAEMVEGKKKAGDYVLINFENGNYQYYEEYTNLLEAKITLIPKDEDFKDEIGGDVVVLEDGLIKAKRNVDYIEAPDEFFSRNHVIYAKRGYIGFSDYSIVGNVYEESGFAPVAIAIHIVYFGNKEEVRVHHFVSESNESISDPARKFEEAMKNLMEWEQFEDIPKTMGLESLIECYDRGKFPGLGVIKKYSLMHHIEMMGKYLEDK